MKQQHMAEACSVMVGALPQICLTKFCNTRTVGTGSDSTDQRWRLQQQHRCSPATEGCLSDGEGSAKACELDGSPSLRRRGLLELPDAAMSLKALILGLSPCCEVGD